MGFQNQQKGNFETTKKKKSRDFNLKFNNFKEPNVIYRESTSNDTFLRFLSTVLGYFALETTTGCLRVNPQKVFACYSNTNQSTFNFLAQF